MPVRHDLSVGGEVFHILCKRVAHAAHPKQLTGVEYDAPCDGAGPLPASDDPNVDAYHLARLQAMVDPLRRPKILAALDQVFGAAPTSGSGAFASGELDNFLQSLIPFYDPPNDLTPQNTRAIAKIMDELLSGKDIPNQVLKTLERVAPRVGYRPVNYVLGAVRPALTYPNIDDLSRQFLTLLGAGGKAHGTFVNILRAGALELAEPSDTANVPADQRTLRFATNLLFSTDADFASAGAMPLYVVKRDDQGMALLADGVAPTGQSPFQRSLGNVSGYGADGRAVDAQGNPVYQYLDANQTLLAGLMREQYQMLNRESPDEPSTVEKLARGLRPIMGPTVARTHTFGNAAALNFNGPDVQQGAVFDLVHAVSELLKYPQTEDLLKVLNELMTKHESDAAGPVWAGLQINELSKNYPNAKLIGLDGEGMPHEFWDDLIDVGVRMLQRPGQFEAVLRSFSKPDAVAQTALLAQFMKYKDQVSYPGAPITLINDAGKASGQQLWYDHNPLIAAKGTTYANADQMNSEVQHQLSQLVDRTMPDVGMNRSLWQRLLSTIHATNGAPNCNKEGALLHVADPLTGALLTFPDPASRADGPENSNAIAQIANLACKAAAGFTGAYKACQFVKQPNGAEAHMRSIIGKGAVIVKDTQLSCLHDAGLANDLGDTQEAYSQIKGFKLTLTPQSIARFIAAPRNYFVTELFDDFPTVHGVPVKDFEPDILFALEMSQNSVQFNGQPQSFLTASKALTHAFDDHEFFEKTEDGETATHGYMFAELLSTLHMHWPSRRMDPKTGMRADCPATVVKGNEGCSQSLDPKKPFYSPQTNLVSYEPILIDSIDKVKIGEILQKSSDTLSKIKLPNGKDGITVLSDFVTLLITPQKDLAYRDGHAYSLTNTCVPMQSASGQMQCAGGRGRVIGDGKSGVMPIYLVLDALKGIDNAFAGSNAERHDPWLQARSKLVDQFLTVDASNPDPSKATFQLHNRRAKAVTLKFLPWLIDRLDKHTQAKDLASWADGLTDRLAKQLGHPAVAAGLDLLDTVWDEKQAGAEFAKVSAYLMDEANHPDAFAGLIVAAVDTLNLVDRDPDLTPLVQFASLALSPDSFDVLNSSTGDAKPAVETGVAYLGLELTRRIVNLQPGVTPTTISKLLKNAVLPEMNGESPLEAFIDTAAEVNRKTPSDPADKPLVVADYQNVFDQVRQFLMDPEHGMERLYKVIQGRSLSTTPAFSQNTTSTQTQATNP